MAINYNVYLDGIKINDSVKDLDKLALAIIRESGFNNTEQIFRDDITTQLQFTGDGFKYISEQRKLNYCKEISCIIDAVCENNVYTIFDGIIKQTKVELAISKCICKVNNIKDNSFSGLIRDFIAIETPLFYTKTKECLPLSIPVITINTPTTPNTYSITDVKTFDVLDVFKYLVAFYTDNRIEVKSDYLTNNKFAITLGYNLHNYNGQLEQQYPSVSIDVLFNELRKKLTIYKAIEYEPTGRPYLRIEDENYFFTDDELLVINEKQIESIEKIDEAKLFNDLKVGSNLVKLKDTTTPIVQQDRLTAWNEEVYVNCAGCSGEKGSTLDLISDFVIDANLIHEAMNESEGSDYEHDDKIFLLNYYYSGFNYKLVGNNLSNYNETLNNENVLNRWIGISNSCIALYRFNKYGFRYVNPYDLSPTSTNDHIIHDGYAVNNQIITSYLGCKDKSYDNKNTVDYITDITSYTGNPNFLNNGDMSIFTCQEDGLYKFRAYSKIIEFKPPTDLDALYMAVVNYRIKFIVFSDNTLSTIINSSPVEDLDVTNSSNVQVTSVFDIESPTFSLSSGNVVCVQISIDATGQFYLLPFNYYHIFCDSVFELVSDNTSCESISDNTDDFKPFETEFYYKLCLDDYLKMRLNKKGAIMYLGEKTWIKEIEYNPNKLSKLTLLHPKTFYNV